MPYDFRRVEAISVLCIHQAVYIVAAGRLLLETQNALLESALLPVANDFGLAVDPAGAKESDFRPKFIIN